MQQRKRGKTFSRRFSISLIMPDMSPIDFPIPFMSSLFISPCPFILDRQARYWPRVSLLTSPEVIVKELLSSRGRRINMLAQIEYKRHEDFQSSKHS